jgi:hypothetical protein
LRCVVISWHYQARLMMTARLFTSKFETRKMRQTFQFWRSTVNAVRLAPILKLHTYALAASRRAAMSQSRAVQSTAVAATLSSPTSRPSQIPWRS